MKGNGMKSAGKHLFIPGALLGLALAGLVMYLLVGLYNHLYGMNRYTIRDRAAEEGIPALSEDEFYFIYKGQFSNPAKVTEDGIFVEMDVVNASWGDGMLFYADDVEKVLYTTEQERVTEEIGNGRFLNADGTIYINTDVATELFGTKYRINKDASLVVMRETDSLVAEIMKSGMYLLVTPNEEERRYSSKLKKGETVEIYESEHPDYYFAMDENGNAGYILKEACEVSYSELSRKTPLNQEGTRYSLVTDPYVSLVFQQFYSGYISREDYDEVENLGYLINVVAPTWFKLSYEGEITDYASEEYVSWAQSDGYQVWGVFDNDFNDELTYACLSSTETRDKICKKLLSFCQTYNLNGINVDFESISEKTGRYYTQFLRELSFVLRSQGYLLTVDTYVPSSWTAHYDREVMGKVCDYVVVMAYDEHWAGSEPGSTSSKAFTQKAVADSLAQGIPKEKLILGIPWYTRLWITEGGETESVALSMDAVWDAVYDYDLDISFDEASGQSYAEGTDESGVLRQIWMEDTDSQLWRLETMLSSEIAGVGAWSLGFENEMVYDAYYLALFKPDEEETEE